MRIHRLFWGCLAVVVVLVGLPACFVGVVWWGFHVEYLESERARKGYRDEAFAAAKSGCADALIHDFELLSMLASDSDCLANVNNITFSMVDLNDPRIEL